MYIYIPPVFARRLLRRGCVRKQPTELCSHVGCSCSQCIYISARPLDLTLVKSNSQSESESPGRIEGSYPHTGVAGYNLGGSIPCLYVGRRLSNRTSMRTRLQKQRAQDPNDVLSISDSRVLQTIHDGSLPERLSLECLSSEVLSAIIKSVITGSGALLAVTCKPLQQAVNCARDKRLHPASHFGVFSGGEHRGVLTPKGDVHTLPPLHAPASIGDSDRSVSLVVLDAPTLVSASTKRNKPYGKRVVHVTVGREDIVVLTRYGEVYTSRMKVTEGAASSNTEKDGEIVRKEAVGEEEKEVVGVVAGPRHKVAWTCDGQVFTWGSCKSGKLGHGEVQMDEVKVPTMVKALQYIRVAQVGTGADHTVVCAEDGRVFTFGLGNCGQLGHGDFDSQSKPRWVKGLPWFVCRVATGHGNHTVVGTIDGKVITFGHNLFGQLGRGSQHVDTGFIYISKDDSVPKMVRGLKGVHVDMAAGDSHTVVCTDDGKVFTFGSNTTTELGHEKNSRRALMQPMPMRVKALEGKKVYKVAAGAHYTMACANNGEIYTFGKGMVQPSIFFKR